jgi:hypothetical protein
LEFPGKMRLSKDAYLTVQRIYYPGFGSHRADDSTDASEIVGSCAPLVMKDLFSCCKIAT